MLTARWWLIALSTTPAAALLGLALATRSFVSMASHGHSFSRILTLYLATWGLCSLAAPSIMRMAAARSLRRMPLGPTIAKAIALLIFLTVVHAAAAAQLLVWIQPHREMIIYGPLPPFRDQLSGLLPLDALVFCVIWVAGSAAGAYQRARYLEMREVKLEAELARAQLNALQLEIKPHFLFNTLNSIAALIRSHDNPAALDMLLNLSDLMRSTLQRPPDQLAPLGQELDLTRRYVALQQTRFSDRLDVIFQVDGDALNEPIPMFLLQTLVENAIRHGARPRHDTCRIEIGADRQEGVLRLWVRDDSEGLPAAFDLERDAGTGLTNTRSRLRQLYGGAARFVVARRDPRGTVAEVTIPVDAPTALHGVA